MLAFRSIASAISDVWMRLIPCVVGNVIAVVLSSPIIFVLFVAAVATQTLGVLILGTALFVGMMPNPATSGLQAMFYGAVHREPLVGLGEQMAGLRQYWRPALRAWLISSIVTLLLIANIAFYASRHLAVSGVLIVMWSAALVFWLMIQVPLSPLLLDLEEPQILNAFRNAVIVSVSRPFTVMLVFIVWMMLMALAAATGFIAILGLAIGAAIQQYVGYALLESFREEV